MSTRTTRAELEQLVKNLNNRLGRPEYGWYTAPNGENVCRVGAMYLDISYGKPRLQEVVHASGGAREIGPRLPSGQMELQLQSMLYGVELAEANLGGYATLPRWDKADGR